MEGGGNVSMEGIRLMENLMENQKILYTVVNMVTITNLLKYKYWPRNWSTFFGEFSKLSNFLFISSLDGKMDYQFGVWLLVPTVYIS